MASVCREKGFPGATTGRCGLEFHARGALKLDYRVPGKRLLVGLKLGNGFMVYIIMDDQKIKFL